MSAMQNVGTSRCPSALRLDTYYHKALPPEDLELIATHVAQCPKCQSELEIRAQGFAALNTSSQASLARFRNRLDAHEKEARVSRQKRTFKRPRAWFRWWQPLSLVGVGLLAFVILSPKDQEELHSEPDSAVAGQGKAIRAKGAHRLEVFVARGDRVQALVDRDRLQAGDRLRFRVSLSEPRQIMLVGQEQDGTLYRIRASGTGESWRMPAGQKQELPDAVELNDSRGQEGVHLVTCAAAFRFGDLKLANQRLVLPPGCQRSSLHFEKVASSTP